MQNNYCIKDGYQVNNEIVTMDVVSQGSYWNENRIRASRYYQYHVYLYAGEIIGRKNLTSMIDVGCGAAAKLEGLNRKFPALSITGIDQPHPISYCKETYDFGQWFDDDFEHPRQDVKLPTADLVVCADVIEHVQDPDKLLAYIKSRMNENGYLLLSTPDRDLLRGADCMSCPKKEHVREWNKAEFARYVTQSGFDIEAHFCSPAFKPNLNSVFLREAIRRILKGVPYRNNQVILAKRSQNT